MAAPIVFTVEVLSAVAERAAACTRAGSGVSPLAVLDKPSVAIAAKTATKTGEKRILFGLVDTSTHHVLSKAGPTKQQKLRPIKLGRT